MFLEPEDPQNKYLYISINMEHRIWTMYIYICIHIHDYIYIHIIYIYICIYDIYIYISYVYIYIIYIYDICIQWMKIPILQKLLEDLRMVDWRVLVMDCWWLSILHHEFGSGLAQEKPMCWPHFTIFIHLNSHPIDPIHPIDPVHPIHPIHRNLSNLSNWSMSSFRFFCIFEPSHSRSFWDAELRQVLRARAAAGTCHVGDPGRRLEVVHVEVVNGDLLVIYWDLMVI